MSLQVYEKDGHTCTYMYNTIRAMSRTCSDAAKNHDFEKRQAELSLNSLIIWEVVALLAQSKPSQLHYTLSLPLTP